MRNYLFLETKLKKMIQRMSFLISEVNAQYIDGKIDEKTRDIIFSATKEISNYINAKYLKRKPIQKKVTSMIKSVMEEVKKDLDIFDLICHGINQAIDLVITE